MNRVIMMGRIVNDPELKTTPSGVSVCSFRIAVDRNFQKKGEERKSDFFNVTAWRGTAEFITRFFGKGRMIMIEGELQTSQYTDKNGNPATWYDIVVDNAYFTGEKANASNGGYGGYAPANGPGYSEPPPERGSYSSYSEPQSAAPAQSAPAPDFSAADKDDYPF
ncbi:MAG: single-stranded DNA-binding protein [Oscillospiraceae bacterium]|nr:single-stranded DNA-binding protein [Oscillospiraceae bacterium]